MAGGTPQADAWEKAAKRRVELAAIRLTLELAKALMRATPVDTGHAQRNWHTSIAQPVTTPTDDRGAQQRGQAEVLGYKLGMGSLWVANPVDYVFYLNYGTSTKAAAGWIETTTYQVLQRELQRAKEKFGDDSDVTQMIQSVQSQFLDAGNEDAAGNIASAYSPFGDE